MQGASCDALARCCTCILTAELQRPRVDGLSSITGVTTQCLQALASCRPAKQHATVLAILLGWAHQRHLHLWLWLFGWVLPGMWCYACGVEGNQYSALHREILCLPSLQLSAWLEALP